MSRSVRQCSVFAISARLAGLSVTRSVAVTQLIERIEPSGLDRPTVTALQTLYTGESSGWLRSSGTTATDTGSSHEPAIHFVLTVQCAHTS